MKPGDMDVTGHGHYTLDENHQPVEATSLLEWARWFEDCSNRIVKQESVGPYWVLTVFLGLDHDFTGPAIRRALNPDYTEPPHEPILFQTMVFAKLGREKELNIQDRCSTWEQAELQHARIVGDMQKVIAG